MNGIRKGTILTEQSALEDWTHPESSFRIQQAVSRSLVRVLSICCIILLSTLIQGANLAPKCIRSAALGPNLKIHNGIVKTFNFLKRKK